jgi:polyphosphate:AMP phosphotransferase
MFEDAELGHTVAKDEYATRSAELRDALLDAQYALKRKPDFPVIVIVGGVEGGGRGETVNALTSWMDPRHIEVNGIGEPSAEERERPRLWPFWRALPSAGKIGIFFGSWYTWPIVNSVMGAKKPHWARLERRIVEINRFEKMLADEGALILKFWFHLSKKAQRKRIRDLKKDPLTRWRITERDEAYFKRYDRFREVSEFMLRDTSQAYAPWIIVEGTDRRYRELATAERLLDGLRSRLAHPSMQPKLTASSDPTPGVDTNRTVLSELDLTQKLTRKTYERDLEKWQGKIALLTRHKRFRDHSVVIVFEGNDAAGKGGAIKRLAAAVDARMMRIIPIAAPTDEEKAHPYLWRFWRHIPRRGNFAVFDRSWYGRVLVERVEGLCSPWDWQRAYGEIADLEDEMTASGVVLAKFWLAISKQEQLRRFKAREQVSFKQFKITEEDWRNRKKWGAYSDAVCDMVTHTSTQQAPWTLVEANDKNFARVKILKTVHDALERALD